MRAAGGAVRPAYAALAGLLDNRSSRSSAQNAAEGFFAGSASPSPSMQGGSTERLIFDLIPRILDRSEWDLVERGCLQRVKAINTFLYDIYHDQEIIKAGLVPQEFVLLNSAFRRDAWCEPEECLAHCRIDRSLASTISCSRTTCAVGYPTF
jgi:uncharacterized circularly permuted ATP-grasp superfamily protein